MTFGPSEWRAQAAKVAGLEAALWCAIGLDGAPHPKRSGRIAIPLPAYAGGAGGGFSNWLGSMAAFLGMGADRYARRNGEAGVALTEADFARVLAGAQLPTLRISQWDILEARSDLRRPRPLTQCRWDADLWTDHASHGKEPAKDRVLQDQTVNALAAIGLASCPSAPMRRGLSTPMVVARPARGERSSPGRSGPRRCGRRRSKRF